MFCNWVWQAMVRDLLMERLKWGTATAINKPMIATTIITSTSVKPLARIVLIFILLKVFTCLDPPLGSKTTAFVNQRVYPAPSKKLRLAKRNGHRAGLAKL